MAQATDTVGVSSDTTSIKVIVPLGADTNSIELDTTTNVTIAPDISVVPGTQPVDTLTWQARHSPRRAAIYSAIIPGAGQIYNRKYWKAPIVWAGIGISYTFIRDNSREYKRYREAYLALVDDDPATTDEFNGQYSPTQVRAVMETYQRWRDISYIAIAGVYILNIIDASVDAHFVRFDVSPDLSLRLGPSLRTAAIGGVGLSLQLAVR